VWKSRFIFKLIQYIIVVNGGLTLQVWLPATNQTLHSIIVSCWNFIRTSQFYEQNWFFELTRLVKTSFKVAVRTGFKTRLVKHWKAIIMATMDILVLMVFMINVYIMYIIFILASENSWKTKCLNGYWGPIIEK
jgi:hypothetical protein